MGEAGKKTWPGSEKNQSSKGSGDAEGNNKPELDLTLGISDMYSTPKEEVATPAASSVTVNTDNTVNTNQTGEDEASKPDSDLKLATETKYDPERLRRILSNRNASRDYRMSMNAYSETDALALQVEISKMCLELSEAQAEHQLLLLEHHQLSLKMAAGEKKRLMKEVEIKKNMEEVKKLKELVKNHELEVKADEVDDLDDDLHELIDLNLNV